MNTTKLPFLLQFIRRNCLMSRFLHKHHFLSTITVCLSLDSGRRTDISVRFIFGCSFPIESRNTRAVSQHARFTNSLSYKLVFKRNGLRVIYAIILLTLSPISLFLSGVSLTNQWLLLWLARAPMALPSSRRKKLSKTNTKFFSRKYIFTPVLPPHSTVLFYLWYFVVHRQTRWTNRLQRCQPCLLGAHFPQYSTRLFSGNTSATATVRGKRGENVFSGSLLIWYLYICPAIRQCLPITQAHKGLKSGQRLDDLMGGKKKKSPPQASAPAAPGNGVVEEPRKQAATSKPAKDSKSKGENHSQREHFTPRLRRLHCIFTPINKILVWI